MEYLINHVGERNPLKTPENLYKSWGLEPLDALSGSPRAACLDKELNLHGAVPGVSPDRAARQLVVLLQLL